MKEVDIIPDDPISVECIKQSEQEIRILRHLKHRSIVQYYGSEIVCSPSTYPTICLNRYFVSLVNLGVIVSYVGW